MYHTYSLTPSYRGQNWLLPALYNLPHDLLCTGSAGVVLTEPPTNNPPLFVSMLNDPSQLTLRFSPEMVGAVGVGQQTQTLQHKLQHFRPQTNQLPPPPPQILQFRQKLQRAAMINAKVRPASQRFKRKSVIRCDICKVNLNSRLQASQHFNGKNHLRILNKNNKTEQNTSAASICSSTSSNDLNNSTITSDITTIETLETGNKKSIPDSEEIAHETEEKSFAFYDPTENSMVSSKLSTHIVKHTSQLTPIPTTTTTSFQTIKTKTTTSLQTLTTQATTSLQTTTNHTPFIVEYLAPTQPPQSSPITKPDADSTINEEENDEKQFEKNMKK